MRTPLTLALPAALVGIFLLAPAALAQDVEKEFVDTVRALDDDGNPLTIKNVRLDSVTYEKVVYTLRGGRTTSEKDGRQVLSVQYGDAPKVYVEGQLAMSRGQYESAASAFRGAKNAVEFGKARPWVLEYAAAMRGKALTALAQAKNDPPTAEEAIREYKEALGKNPKSLLLADIQVGLCECYALSGRWDEGKAAATALVTTGKAINFPWWQALGQQALAHLLLAQGRPMEAANTYNDLALLAQRELGYAKGELRKKQLGGLLTEAVIEQGWARIARAKASGQEPAWQDAAGYFRGLRGRYPKNEQVAAAVLNGEGRCLLDKDPRAALLKFTEAEVTYFKAHREVARALYLKSLAYGRLKESKLARQAIDELREFYPESEWARRQN